MKKIFFFVSLLFSTITIKSQILTIFNKETEEPIDMVIISDSKLHKYITTNSKGKADLSSIKDAEQIEIHLIGYNSILTNFAELEAQNFTLYLIPTNINMGEIIVSADRWFQNSINVPSKVSIISQKDFSICNPQTAADLLNVSGNVFIQKSQQGGGSPMIRGFSTNRLLYTVDGVRMNTAIFRAGNLQNVISLDPFALENTEIFFGASSVIYGSDAIGGVMSFQTLVPEISSSAENLITGKAVTRYSSANNEKTYHFDINLGWKKFAMLTSLSFNDYGNLTMGTKGPKEYTCPYYVIYQDSNDVIVTNPNPLVQKPTAYTQTNFMQKFRYRPNEKIDIQFGFHYSETSTYSRYDRLIRYKNGLPRYGEWSYGPQIWMMNNLNVTHSVKSFLYNQMTIILTQQYFEESRISRDIFKTDREIRTEKVNAYSFNMDFIKNLGKKTTLLYGLELVQNYVKSTGINTDISTGVSLKGPSRYPQSVWASYAAYISDKYSISEKFLVQGALRYNKYTIDALFDTTFYPFPFETANINDGKFTGSLGFVIKPANKTVISCNLATAFRSPNVDDLGKVFDSEPGSVVVPNPNLKAEYAYNVDINFAQIFGNFIKFDASAYYTYLDNALVRRDFRLNGLDSIMYDGTMSKVQAIQNAAFAKIFGFQASLNIKLPSGFGISSNFNYQKGVEELDDCSISPSRHAPPLFGDFKILYNYKKLNMMFYAIYNGEKKFENMPLEEIKKDYIYAIDKNGNPYSPAWFTINFKSMFQVNENIIISAGIENITNERYRPYSSGIVAAGRNIVISLKLKF